MKISKIQVADFVAALIFFTLFGMTNELAIMHLTIWQSLRARALAVLVILWYGPLFGAYWGWLAPKLIKVWKKDKTVNTFIFLSFDLLAGASMMLTTGPSFWQFTRGIVALALSCLFLGHIYVLWLKQVRRWFGVKQNSS